MANQMAILRKVLRRIRRYWVGLVASLLLATLYVVMSLYIPILVGNAIDCIIDAGRVDFTAMWGYLRNVAICAAVAALVEKTCWQAIAPELELGMTTVGTSLQLAHTAPTPIGMVVQCDCEVLEVTDRRVRFGFRVYDDVTEVAGGEHERYLVDAERFLKKAESKI